MPAVSLVRAAAVLATGLAGYFLGAEFRNPFPPGAPSFVRAIGPVADLPDRLRLAFAAGPGFDPIGRPAERGQSFSGYVRSGPTLATGVRRRLDLQPLLSDAPPETLLPFAEYAARFFGLATSISPPIGLVPLEPALRGFGSSTGEKRLDTQALFDFLADRVPPDACCVIAITTLPLGSDGRREDALLGEASLRDRVGVASFEGNGWSLRRDAMVLTHEIAHTFGLPHCVHFRCLMNRAGVERKPMHLCPVCLRKLHHATGLDPAERYRALFGFYRAVGLVDEAEWTEARLREIEPGH